MITENDYICGCEESHALTVSFSELTDDKFDKFKDKSEQTIPAEA